MGIAAQLPVAIIILYSMDMVTVKTLTKNRGIIIMIIMIISSLLTPPDVISLLLLSCPLYVCYELSVIFCKIMDKSVGDALHKKRSRMLVFTIITLTVFLCLGIASQIYRGSIRSYLHKLVENIFDYNQHKLNTNYDVADFKIRLNILNNWNEIDLKYKSEVTDSLISLWKEDKLSSQEKRLLFLNLSDFGLNRKKEKINVTINLPTQLIEKDAKLLYYLKAIVRDNVANNSEVSHFLYFGNELQYLTYGSGKNLFPNIQINDIVSLFPQLKFWENKNKIISLSLVVSPVKGMSWLGVIESKPFTLRKPL